MSRWLYEYWRDVKDTSWPDVEFWSDFVKTDQAIQKECQTMHKLDSRINAEENFEYWHCRSLYPMYRKENLIFVNVPKCGYVHYRDFFLERLGWESFVPDRYCDLDGTIMFGIMMDPCRRYLKGITEFLWSTGLYQHVDLQTLFKHIMFPDIHSAPVLQILGAINSKIHWIPFESMTDEDVKSCMNSLFFLKSSSITVPLSHPQMHESTKEKTQLYEQIKEIFFNHTITSIDPTGGLSQAWGVHRALIPDSIFYRDLTSKFSPDWQHLD